MPLCLLPESLHCLLLYQLWVCRTLGLSCVSGGFPVLQECEDVPVPSMVVSSLGFHCSIYS